MLGPPSRHILNRKSTQSSGTSDNLQSSVFNSAVTPCFQTSHDSIFQTPKITKNHFSQSIPSSQQQDTQDMVKKMIYQKQNQKPSYFSFNDDDFGFANFGQNYGMQQQNFQLPFASPVFGVLPNGVGNQDDNDIFRFHYQGENQQQGQFPMDFDSGSFQNPWFGDQKQQQGSMSTKTDHNQNKVQNNFSFQDHPQSYNQLRNKHYKNHSRTHQFQQQKKSIIYQVDSKLQYQNLTNPPSQSKHRSNKNSRNLEQQSESNRKTQHDKLRQSIIQELSQMNSDDWGQRKQQQNCNFKCAQNRQQTQKWIMHRAGQTVLQGCVMKQELFLCRQSASGQDNQEFKDKLVEAVSAEKQQLIAPPKPSRSTLLLNKRSKRNLLREEFAHQTLNKSSLDKLGVIKQNLCESIVKQIIPQGLGWNDRSIKSIKDVFSVGQGNRDRASLSQVCHKKDSKKDENPYAAQESQKTNKKQQKQTKSYFSRNHTKSPNFLPKNPPSNRQSPSPQPHTEQTRNETSVPSRLLYTFSTEIQQQDDQYFQTQLKDQRKNQYLSQQLYPLNQVETRQLQFHRSASKSGVFVRRKYKQNARSGLLLRQRDGEEKLQVKNDRSGLLLRQRVYEAKMQVKLGLVLNKSQKQLQKLINQIDQKDEKSLEAEQNQDTVSLNLKKINPNKRTFNFGNKQQKFPQKLETINLVRNLKQEDYPQEGQDKTALNEAIQKQKDFAILSKSSESNGFKIDTRGFLQKVLYPNQRTKENLRTSKASSVTDELSMLKPVIKFKRSNRFLNTSTNQTKNSQIQQVNNVKNQSNQFNQSVKSENMHYQHQDNKISEQNGIEQYKKTQIKQVQSKSQTTILKQNTKTLTSKFMFSKKTPPKLLLNESHQDEQNPRRNGFTSNEKLDYSDTMQNTFSISLQPTIKRQNHHIKECNPKHFNTQALFINKNQKQSSYIKHYQKSSSFPSVQSSKSSQFMRQIQSLIDMTQELRKKVYRNKNQQQIIYRKIGSLQSRVNQRFSQQKLKSYIQWKYL